MMLKKMLKKILIIFNNKLINFLRNLFNILMIFNYVKKIKKLNINDQLNMLYVYNKKRIIINR